jgi:hypothetical protein
MSHVLVPVPDSSRVSPLDAPGEVHILDDTQELPRRSEW